MARGALFYPLIVTGLLVGGSVAVFVPAQAHEADRFEWAAPLDKAGPGVFAVDVDFGDDNACSVALSATGTAQLGPVAWFRVGGENHMVTYGADLQLHAEGLGLDTREAPDDEWDVLQTTMGTDFSGVQNIAVAVTDMKSVNGRSPAHITIDCAHEFGLLGFAGSQEAVAFDDVSLDGTGMTTAASTLSVNDRIEASFDSTQVEVSLLENLDAPGPKAYTLETPNAVYEGVGLGIGGTARFHDGPGDYRFELTQAGVGFGDSLRGWMLGMHAVDSLDDILA